MSGTNIDISEGNKELGLVVGKSVSHIWRGYGTYSVLEIGEIHEKVVDSPRGKDIEKYGDWTITFLGDWKMFKGSDEIADSINDDLKVLDFKLQLLKGSIIRSINLSKDNKSASIFFDNDMGITINAVDYGFLSISNFERKRSIIFEPSGKIKVEY